MDQQQQRSLGSVLTASKDTCRSWWHDTVVPALLGDEEQVKQLKSSKDSRWTCTKGCVQGVRPYLVVLAFLIMALWLPLDVWRLDGIVPGTKESYMVEPKLLQENAKAIYEWYYNFTSNGPDSDDSVYSCPCSIDQVSTEFSPFARLQRTGHVRDLETFNEQVQKFMGACNESAFNLNTDGGKMAATEAHQFVWAASLVRITPEASSVLLTRQAWHWSRLVETRKQLNALGDQAFMRLRTELGLANRFELLSNGTDRTIPEAQPLYQLNRFFTAYEMFAAALLFNTSAGATDGASSGRTGNISSVSFLEQLYSLPANRSSADWPLKLQEFNVFKTQWAQWKRNMSQKDPDLPSDPYHRAYDAYARYCYPIMCSKVTKKGPYLRTMQGMAVFGGMWGIVTLAILVVWKCAFLGCVVGHQEQKHADKEVPRMPSSMGCCGGGATPADVCVSIEPESQSMDRAPVADKV